MPRKAKARIALLLAKFDMIVYVNEALIYTITQVKLFKTWHFRELSFVPVKSLAVTTCRAFHLFLTCPLSKSTRIQGRKKNMEEKSLKLFKPILSPQVSQSAIYYHKAFHTIKYTQHTSEQAVIPVVLRTVLCRDICTGSGSRKTLER